MEAGSVVDISSVEAAGEQKEVKAGTSGEAWFGDRPRQRLLRPALVKSSRNLELLRLGFRRCHLGASVKLQKQGW